MDCNIDKKTLNKRAVHRESTLNPPTILSHNKMIKALMNNKNKPRVTMVIGSVNIMRTGLIKILSSPRTIDIIKAVVKPAT
jgi:hypothetical protein